MNNTQKSLIAILICYFSWGLFPIYFKLLKEIGAYEVLAMRIICSFVFMIIVVAIAKNKKSIFNEITTLWKDKKSVLLLVLASFLITLNWLTYIIAVNTNHVLEASFGYYLNPIVTIILAVVFLKEKLTRTQTIACLCVGGSLIYLFISLGSLPWISILLALSFGLYSLCKKKIVLSPKASLLIETAIVSPIALIYMGYLSSNNSITFYSFGTDTLIYLLLSGVITAVPLMLFAKGATAIPLYILGILQYLPPTMQFFIGIFVYGEVLSIQKLISFSIIWVAVAAFCYSAVISMKKQNLINESHKKIMTTPEKGWFSLRV